MVHREGIIKEIWDTFVVFLLLALAVEIPLRIALGYAPGPALIAANGVVSLIFFIDIIFHFRTSVLKNGRVIVNRGDLARNYLKSWFAADLLGALPLDLLLMFFLTGSGGAGRLVLWIRIIRLVKLLRIFHLMNLWSRRQVINPSVLRLIFFMAGMIFIAHWIACGWILMGGSGNYNAFFPKYIKALYWTVTTLTTVGYGDIVPIGIPQTIFTMVVMVLGVGGYGYVIGNIASLIANIDVVKAQQKKKMEEVNSFLKLRAIPRRLQDRVRNYYEYMFASARGYNEEAIIDELPFSLKRDVAMQLNKDLLEKVPFFQGAEESCIRELVTRMGHVLATPGDYIIRHDEVADVMYFISKGRVEVLTPDRKTVIATLGSGSFFGEMSLLTRGKRTAYIRAVEYCSLYTLDKDTFDQVQEKYPAFHEHVREIAREREKGHGGKK